MTLHGFRRLAAGTALATFGLIVLGGVVRATGSGLGCPDWPTCYGSLIPPMRADALIEYSHRTLAAIVGALVIWIAVAAYRSRAAHPARFWVSGATLLLLGIQAWLGQVVVATELSPPLVSFHLGTAMVLLALLVGLSLPEVHLPRDRVGRTLWHAAIAVYATILVGALVRASGAGVAFADWPLMDGSLVPSRLGETDRLFGFLHRLIVLDAAAHIGVAWWRARRAGSESLRAVAGWVVIVFSGQIVTGAALVWTVLSPVFVVLHLALATAAWVAVIGVAMHFSGGEHTSAVDPRYQG